MAFSGCGAFPSAAELPNPLVQGCKAWRRRLIGSVTPLIAFSEQRVDQNLWLYSTDPSHPPHILVPSIAVESAPAFSPDGTKFAFVSSRGRALEVWVAGIDGVTPRRVTSLGDATVIYTPSWSADGASVVYSARRQGKNGAWETNVTTLATTLLRQSDSYSNSPQLAADGSLYFVSNAEHVFRIWRQLFNRPESAEPLTVGPVTAFRMTPDGRSLYFIRQGSHTAVMRMDVATREEAQVFVFPDGNIRMDAWDIAGAKLYYVTLDSYRCVASVMAVDLASGKQNSIGEFPVRSVEHWQPAISVAPDGHYAIVAQTDRDDARLDGRSSQRITYTGTDARQTLEHARVTFNVLPLVTACYAAPGR